ncbi:MAG: type III-B CRISPR module RAMP protein Cmr4 [Polyangiaceae bacterium]|nr:type III-B CRISPR module RAMP protein Cmr4 [Polyangiaceae bacterium]
MNDSEETSLVFLYAETPLHAGSGTALGAVDLPIQRERMSHLPMVQGSGIKGALREQIGALLRRGGLREPADLREELVKELDTPAGRDNLLWQTFGPPPPSSREEGEDPESEKPPTADEFGGAVSLLDARLLLFPARTVWGGWAWLTSPMILQRLARDLELVGGELPAWRELRVDEDGAALVCAGSQVARDGVLLVEDLEYASTESKEATALAAWLSENAFPGGAAYAPFRARIAPQLAVVGDAEMKFLTEHATEVVARIRVSPETGTVETGALWSEESLPAETLLWSTAFFADGKRKPGEKQQQPAFRSYKAEELRRLFGAAGARLSRIRLGGDRTTGRGIVGIRVTGGGRG